MREFIKLQTVAVSLAHGSYSADTKLNGVIYLHDISSARLKGTNVRNLEVFQKLVGTALCKVLLVRQNGTNWNFIPKDKTSKATL